MEIKPDPASGLPFVVWYQPAEAPKTPELRVGDVCPRCKSGLMAYDGMLNLSCSQCGYSLSGGAGCT